MGKRIRIAAVLALAGLLACGRKPPRPEPLVNRAVARPVQAQATDFYERDGSLKGSATRVEWLEIPAAFKRSAKRSYDMHEVYEADGVPFEKTCDFLGKRMFTGKVERGTDRAFYHAVMPLDMSESAARLHVSLAQVRGQMTLDIERMPRVEPKPLSEEEARELLTKDLAQAE